MSRAEYRRLLRSVGWRGGKSRRGVPRDVAERRLARRVGVERWEQEKGLR